MLVITDAFGAGTSGGESTIVNPANNTALAAGGSQTTWSFKLPDPPGDRCSGDSATDGYRVQSYLTPIANDPLALTYTQSDGPNQPAGSFAAPLFDTSGSPYISQNTAAVTGQVKDFPGVQFNFDKFSADGSNGTFTLPLGDYNVGIACSGPSGTDKVWNRVLKFVASQSDPRGETWTQEGLPAATTTTTAAATSTTTTVASTTTTTAGGTTTTTTAGATTTTTAAPTTTTTVASTTTTTAAPTTTAPPTTVPPTTAPPTTVPPTTTPPTTAPPTTVAQATTTVAQATTTTTIVGGTVSPVAGSAGGTFSINSTGWQGNVTLVFHSDPVTLGTLTANSAGVISGTFAVPASASVGAHTIELSGTGASGAARTVSLAFTVTGSAVTSPVSGLPRTGSDPAPLVRFGLGLVAAGAMLVIGRRRIRSNGS